MFNEKQINEMIDLLIEYPDSKIYLGTDSVRVKKNGKSFAKFATVLVLHKDGRHGCKVFINHSVEPDYDFKKNKPSQRLMNEVLKTCELYTQLAPLIDSYDIQIHLDINPDPKHGSSCVATQAAGYVMGVTGIEAKLKPFAFAASFSADHYAPDAVFH